MKSLVLLAIIAPALWAAPVIIETKEMTPPVNWKTTPMSQEPWWNTLMADFQPEKFTFQDWSKYYSKDFIQKNKITEELFKQHAKSVAEMRDTVHPISEIVRIIFIKDEGAEFLKIVETVGRHKDPQTGDIHRITFLKKEKDGWINWTIPSDMTFDASLTNL